MVVAWGQRRRRRRRRRRQGRPCRLCALRYACSEGGVPISSAAALAVSVASAPRMPPSAAPFTATCGLVEAAPSSRSCSIMSPDCVSRERERAHPRENGREGERESGRAWARANGDRTGLVGALAEGAHRRAAYLRSLATVVLHDPLHATRPPLAVRCRPRGRPTGGWGRLRRRRIRGNVSQADLGESRGAAPGGPLRRRAGRPALARYCLRCAVCPRSSRRAVQQPLLPAGHAYTLEQ